MSTSELSILVFVLLLSASAVVYAGREIRRVRALAYEEGRLLREEIRDRDRVIEELNRATAFALRDLWISSQQKKRVEKLPDAPAPQPHARREMSPRNGILP